MCIVTNTCNGQGQPSSHLYEGHRTDTPAFLPKLSSAKQHCADVAPLLPAGTVIHLASWHANSTKYPWNPDPGSWVGYWERTTEDMSRAWLNFYSLTEAEFKAEVEARNAKKVHLVSQR